MKIIQDILGAHQLLLKTVEKISEEKFHEIPPNFKNNIYWNVGHVTQTLAVFTYKLSAVTPPFDEKFMKVFDDGESPLHWPNRNGLPSIAEVNRLLIDFPKQIETEIKANTFANFKPYTTTGGVVISSIEDALQFCYFHDGLHIGYVTAQKRILGA